MLNLQESISVPPPSDLSAGFAQPSVAFAKGSPDILAPFFAIVLAAFISDQFAKHQIRKGPPGIGPTTGDSHFELAHLQRFVPAGIITLIGSAAFIFLPRWGVDASGSLMGLAWCLGVVFGLCFRGAKTISSLATSNSDGLSDSDRKILKQFAMIKLLDYPLSTAASQVASKASQMRKRQDVHGQLEASRRSLAQVRGELEEMRSRVKIQSASLELYENLIHHTNLILDSICEADAIGWDIEQKTSERLLRQTIHCIASMDKSRGVYCGLFYIKDREAVPYLDTGRHGARPSDWINFDLGSSLSVDDSFLCYCVDLGVHILWPAQSSDARFRGKAGSPACQLGNGGCFCVPVPKPGPTAAEIDATPDGILVVASENKDLITPEIQLAALLLAPVLDITLSLSLVPDGDEPPSGGIRNPNGGVNP